MDVVNLFASSSLKACLSRLQEMSLEEKLTWREKDALFKEKEKSRHGGGGFMH